MSGPWAGVLFAGIAGLGNVGGGSLVLLNRKWSKHWLKASLAFSGGFMLAAAIVAMAPESLELMPEWGAVLILVGYLAVHFLEHVVGGHYHFAGDQHGPDHIVSATATGATVFAMLVHTFFDGVAIGSAFSIGEQVGFFIFLSVIFHKIPAGFAVSTVALASGIPARRAFAFAALMGLGTVVGSLVLRALGPLAPYAIPISAGTLIHVAASDLIPEVNEGEGWPITTWVIGGAVLFIVAKVVMGPHLH
jgi:zinc transporter ZupT